jgi:hypothetical protein
MVVPRCAATAFNFSRLSLGTRTAVRKSSGSASPDGGASEVALFLVRRVVKESVQNRNTDTSAQRVYGRTTLSWPIPCRSKPEASVWLASAKRVRARNWSFVASCMRRDCARRCIAETCPVGQMSRFQSIASPCSCMIATGMAMRAAPDEPHRPTSLTGPQNLPPTRNATHVRLLNLSRWAGRS